MVTLVSIKLFGKNGSKIILCGNVTVETVAYTACAGFNKENSSLRKMFGAFCGLVHEYVRQASARKRPRNQNE